MQTYKENTSLLTIINKVNDLKPRVYSLGMQYGDRIVKSIYFTQSATDKVTIESYAELAPTIIEVPLNKLTVKEQFDIYCTLYTLHTI